LKFGLAQQNLGTIVNFPMSEHLPHLSSQAMRTGGFVVLVDPATSHLKTP
jgi:hypothetical protein